VDNKLTFLLNPGPALVEPSVTNPADPNINFIWDFVELTFNQNVAFANISYVDFVGLPVSATLTTTNGNTFHISGMSLIALRNICSALKFQSAIDGQPWANLIVNNTLGKPLRILSPNNGMVLDPTLFKCYFDSYVNQVWQQYTQTCLSVDTQAQWGVVSGSVNGTQLVVDGCLFNKPTTGDIFSCSTGPFSGGSVETLCIIPRIAAAFNRSTLLNSSVTPAPAGVPLYTSSPTNHYARIVHEQLLDGKGYAFPYDDVAANGDTTNQAGAVYDSNPKQLTFAVGGNGAYVDAP
jgi:Beta-1,3-glucanase